MNPAPSSVVLVPAVPALLPSYASIDDPVAELRAACADAVAGFGPRAKVVTGEAGLRVGRSLLTGSGREVADDATDVLVVGNGSAKRSRQAPGYFDERAESFDEDLRRALLEPRPGALGAIDPQLAEEMWADVAALRTLGELITPSCTAEVLYDDAPYGVQYWVVRWS